MSMIHSVFSKDGQRISTIGSAKTTFRNYKLDPYGVTTDSKGNIYVADAENHRLYKLKPDGQVVKSVGGKGNNPGQFYYPSGIELSTDNELFVSDSDNHRVQLFDTDLNLIRYFGREGIGDGAFLKYPRDLALDSDGHVYVTDSGNHCVKAFTQSGAFIRTFGRGHLGEPFGIHVDHDYVYVTKWDRHCVSVFTTSGTFITTFGKMGSGEGKLRYPHGITIDEDGFVYVCDTNNSCVRVFLFPCHMHIVGSHNEQSVCVLSYWLCHITTCSNTYLPTCRMSVYINIVQIN